MLKMKLHVKGFVFMDIYVLAYGEPMLVLLAPKQLNDL
jgi:hypothetical protein